MPAAQSPAPTAAASPAQPKAASDSSIAPTSNSAAVGMPASAATAHEPAKPNAMPSVAAGAGAELPSPAGAQTIAAHPPPRIAAPPALPPAPVATAAASPTASAESAPRQAKRPTGPAADKWLISETSSPLDYSPVAIASASSTDGQWGLTMKLSVQCRGGRTDVVIGGMSLSRPLEEYVLSYSVDDAQPISLAVTTPPANSGVALKGDVVTLLRSLPTEGTVAFRVAAHTGPAWEGRYALPQLKAALDRLARPCNWPAGGTPK
jgi:hypothetical protein